VLFSSADPVQVGTTVQRLAFAGSSKDVLFSNAFFTNEASTLTETSLAINLGSGNDRFTIVTTHAGATELNTGPGDDQIAVRALRAGGNTTINADGTRNFTSNTLATVSGTDEVHVGSRAGFYPTHTGSPANFNGVLDGINAVLTVHGDPNSPATPDILYLDDTGDPDGEVGVLTATRLTGLGILEKNIEVTEICTYCTPKEYFSHRRDKDTGRHATVIALKG
jgi:hypothetical protein